MFFEEDDMTAGAPDAGMQDDAAMSNDDAATTEEDTAGEAEVSAPAEGEDNAGM